MLILFHDSPFTHLDTQLFYLINSHHSPFWDKVMSYVSLTWTWMPVAFFLIYLIYRAYKRKNTFRFLPFFLMLLLAGISVGLANTLTSEVLKPLVHRYRPCQPEAGLMRPVHIVDEHCGGKFGFASSHAANFFAAATFLSLFFRDKKLSFLFFCAATLVAFSRVYLGVHYPGDVAAGAIIGAICGGTFWWIWEKYVRLKTRNYTVPK